MLFDKDQQRCYIEFKLDGESKQSQDSTKPDCYFGQVFHFHMAQNKNAQRELQILVCNINRGGYMSKQTLGKQSLRDLEFALNKPFDCKFFNKIKERTVTIQLVLSFISNLFIENVQGEIQVDLQSLYPQGKGILAMSLGGSQTVYTCSSGTQAKILNNSPYCKLTLLYYENLALKEYQGVNQIKLLKQTPIKKEIYLCDLNWSKYQNKLTILLDQIKLGSGVIKLLFSITPEQQFQQIQEVEKQIVPTKRVIYIKGIKIEGFPFKELSNAKYYLQIRTPTLHYITHLSVIPQWECDITLYEQNLTFILYNYCGEAEKKTGMLAMFENESEGKLSLAYQQYLKAFYASNPNTYSKIVSCLNLTINCDKEFYTSPIIDNPRGIVKVPMNDYTINEYSGGQSMFETGSIFDFVCIRKFKANKVEFAFDVPIYTIDQKMQFGGQEIPISYEPDPSQKQPVMEEKYEKSTFVKITVWSAKITKHEQLQLSIVTEESEFKTSKIYGIYFGQSFICKFPNKLSLTLTNYTDSDVISDIYSGLIDLGQLDISNYEQFVNLQLSSVSRQGILTLKLEMSGSISQTSKLIITPQSLYPLSTEGQYYVRVYQAYRFLYDLQQVRNDREYLVFDPFEWFVDDIWKPIRFQLFYQSGNKQDDHTLLSDNSFQAIDLLWRNRHYVVREKCRFSIQKQTVHTVQAEKKPVQKPLEAPKLFVKFTLLSIKFKQDELQKEQIKGFAVQLHHIQNDSIARLKDTKNFEYNNGMVELDRTEMNTFKYPIVTQLMNAQLNISLIKHVNDELRISHFTVPVDLKNKDSVQYVEERTDIPVIMKFHRKIIQHMKLSHTSIYDVQITNISLLDGYKLFVDKTHLIDYPWIKDGVLQSKYTESVQPILLHIDEIETFLEFVIFTDVMVFRRYVINLCSIQFEFDTQQNIGTFDLEVEGFKCQIIIRESAEQFKADSINVSFNTLTKLKAMAGKFIKFKFSNNFNVIEFTHQLRYTFTTSLQSYIQAMLLRGDPPLAGQFEYTIVVPESKKFPRNHSIDKIILWEKDLYLIRHEETRGEDMETVIETKIKIRKVHVLTTEPQLEFKCRTKEGKLIQLDQEYLSYQKIKSTFTIGYFEIIIYRLLKDIEKQYVNKFIATNMRVRLKYNNQKYWITRITDQGLMMDGEFQKCQFYVSNINDLLTMQLYIHEYLVAETEFCMALSKDQFIQEIQRILYTQNDLLFHFHQKIKLKNIWVMGKYSFKQANWIKVFMKFLTMTIDLSEEEKGIRRFSLKILNPYLDKNSQVYSTTNSKIAIIQMEDNEIVDQIVHMGEEDKHYFQVQLRQDGEIIGEKLISLRPFIKRGISSTPIEFEFKLSDKVTLKTMIEVSQNWKSQMQQKQTQDKVEFDFRKIGYQQMLLKMLNWEAKVVDVIPEIYEFLMYNLPDKYDPTIIFTICRALFCVFNDKLTIAAFCLQCMATIYLSHKEAVSNQIEIMVLLQQLQDLVLVKDNQFNKLINQPYFEQNLPVAMNCVKFFDYTYNELIAYLRANSHKVSVDIFKEHRDRLSAKIVLSCIKIFDSTIQNNVNVGLKLIEKLPVIVEAYRQYDDFNDKLGVTFTIFINSLLNIYNTVDVSNYLNQTEEKNIDISSFKALLDVLFQTVEKASYQEFISILVTMHNLIKILNTDQLPFLKLILKTLIRSIVVQKDLEMHIGIAVEYFQACYQDVVKEVLKLVKLEEMAIKISKHEFENRLSSNVLSNLFDMIVQSIELGVEQPFSELQAFLKKEQPKQDSNRIKIEKFLLYMDKRQERAQRIQMLQQKQIKTQSVDEQKKQVMERFMISKLPW